MSNYTKSTNFATKDNLSPGDPLKIVRGTEIDTEFNNISTAISTKTDNSAAAITGGSITGITDLAVADGGTGASTATAALNNLLPSQSGNSSKYLQTDGTNATWDAISINTGDITGTLPVANGGTGITSFGTGIATFLGTPSSANLASAVTDDTGSGALVFANTPTLVAPILGTPTSGNFSSGSFTWPTFNQNTTGTAAGLSATLAIASGGTGQTTANAAFNALAPSQTSASGKYLKSDGTNTSWDALDISTADITGTLPVANGGTGVTSSTGTGNVVLSNSPTLVTPILGTPQSGNFSTGTFTWPTFNQNTTGTAAGLSATLATTSGGTGLTSFTSGGVVYASSSSALATGSALTFDGTAFGVGVSIIKNDAPFITGSNVYSASNMAIGSTAGYLQINGSNLHQYMIGGSEVMRLTSSSLYTASGINVGIGLSNPTAKLEVASDGSATNTVYLTDTRAYSATPKSVVGFSFKYNTAGTYTTGSLIQGGKENASDNDYASELSFWTRVNGGNLTKRMELNSSGNLGLGVPPSAWSALGYWKAFQISTVGAHIASSTTAFSAQPAIIVGNNAFYNDATETYRYVSSQPSAQYRQTSGIHAWSSAASGTAGNDISFTQAMTLDASGNLGVGTTSPAAKIDIRGTSTTAFGARNGMLLFNTNSSGNQSNIIGFGSTGSATAACFISTDNPADGSGIYALTLGATTSSGVINFLTNGSERARIDSSGNLLVGTTSALNGTARLDVSAPSGNNLATTLKNDAGAGQWNTQIWNAGTTGDNALIQFATETSYTGRGSITYNRAGGLIAYNVTSDYRAKDISGPVTGSGALIDSIPVYMGTMKGATQERPMFIAHEVPAYAHTGVKDAVDADGNPVYQQMDASALIPVMWAEIQSLRQRLSAANL